jgi:hypothetical protein
LRRLANEIKQQLEQQLCQMQESLNALIQGRIPINLVGYFRQPEVEAEAEAIIGVQPVVVVAVAAGVPTFIALAKALTIKYIWKEWKNGFAGRPAARELEEKWGSRWRPGNTIRIQFCRRKVI